MIVIKYFCILLITLTVFEAVTNAAKVSRGRSRSRSSSPPLKRIKSTAERSRSRSPSRPSSPARKPSPARSPSPSRSKVSSPIKSPHSSDTENEFRSSFNGNTFSQYSSLTGAIRKAERESQNRNKKVKIDGPHGPGKGQALHVHNTQHSQKHYVPNPANTNQDVKTAFESLPPGYKDRADYRHFKLDKKPQG